MLRKHMPSQSPHPGSIRRRHMIKLINPLTASQHDHGNPPGNMRQQLIVHGPSQHSQPINPPGDVINQRFSRRTAARGHHQRKPPSPGLNLGPAQNLIKVEVLHFDFFSPVVNNDRHIIASRRIRHGWPIDIVMPREEQSNDIGAACGQPPSTAAGHVPQKPNCFHNPFAGLLAHGMRGAKHPRNRRDRHLRTIRNVVDSGSFQMPSPATIAAPPSWATRSLSRSDR